MSEYWRRTMTQLNRDAGTEIRRAMVRRHALTAGLNLDRARRVQGLIQRDVESLVPKDEMDTIVRRLRGPQPQEQVSLELNRLLTSWLAAIPALPFRMQELTSHVEELNLLVEVANRIIGDLGGEGIYLAEIQPLTVPQDLGILAALPRAFETANIVVGFLEGLGDSGSQET